MSTTYTLTAPVNVGTLTAPVNVSALQITGITYSATPALAPLGTGTLTVTLTEPGSGWQETITYQDADVLAMWASIGETISTAVFAKLIADGKLPPGALSQGEAASAAL